MESNREQQVWSQGQTQAASVDAGLRSYMLGVYNYMASALVLTGVFAWLGANFRPVQELLYKFDGDVIVGTTPLYLVAVFAPLALVFWLSRRVFSMSFGKAQALFWLYSALMGLSLSSILLMYTAESVARVFFITAIAFGGMSLYGYTTKKDITGWGSFLTMGLIGLIVSALVNLFLASTALQFAVSVIGVLVFAGFTAYHTQGLKGTYYQLAGHGEALMKSALMGALSLYLDFINMFISLINLMGDRR